jgi:DinB superfamily
MNQPFAAENSKERNRLISLVRRLTEQELRLPLGEDWTIAVALAHLSFWDQRALFLLRRWRKSGAVAPSPIDVDLTNDSLLSLWAALPPRAAADLAVSSAEQIDRELEEAPSDLITKIEHLGENFRLYRSIHRKLHVDEIERVLNSRPGT